MKLRRVEEAICVCVCVSAPAHCVVMGVFNSKFHLHPLKKGNESALEDVACLGGGK